MTTNNIIPVKYVFLDIVAYTKRTIEAQCYIIEALNRIVKGTINRYHVDEDSYIYIPTGDGMCIALLSSKLPYDIHMTIAREILRRIHVNNSRVTDNWKKFAVRVGINQCDDNIVTDVNGRKNVTGAGINNTRRIMDLADASQILVSSIVYENLYHRKKYYHTFSPEFSKEVKHGLVLKMHQHVKPHTEGLDVNPPSSLVSLPKPAVAETELSKLLAHYFAHLIKNKAFILNSVKRHASYAYQLKLLFWLLAKESVRVSEDPYDFLGRSVMPDTGSDAIEKQLEWLDENVPFEVAEQVSNLIDDVISLQTPHNYLESSIWDLVVSSSGKEKLKGDWPEFWYEFGLDEVSG
jgi:hypothetical protein